MLVQKCLDPKELWVNKILGSQNVGSKKSFGSKFFKILCPKKYVQKILGQTKFGPKKFDQNKSRPSKIVSKNLSKSGQ